MRMINGMPQREQSIVLPFLLRVQPEGDIVRLDGMSKV